MKSQDDIIKKTLRKEMQRIDDDLFTDEIIKRHLSQKVPVAPRPFLNFVSMIVGLSFTLLSLGLILLVKTNNRILKSIDFSEQHGYILFLLSFFFLIYKWLDDLTLKHTLTNLQKNVTARCKDESD
jgi:hypothetical protein